MSAEARLTKLARGEGAWFDPAGPESDVVLSTRVRLARNIEGTRFPWRADEKELDAVLEDVLTAAGRSPVLRADETLIISDLDPIDRDLLLERHLISAEFKTPAPGRAFIPGANDRLSVMVNEEDHLRLQGIRSGFGLHDCWESVATLDTVLANRLDFAYRPDVGYVTTCPTNVGTGLRVSVLLHLPSLVLTREIDKVIDSVSQIGLTVRGFYGEGSSVVGHFFQISNQITLGKSEEDLVDMIEQVTREVLRYETDARDWLRTDALGEVTDKVYRALGTLESCRMTSAAEVVASASALRLGHSLGFESLPTLSVLNQLVILSQPAHLARLAGHPLTAGSRRAVRAQLAHRLLSGESTLDGEYSLS